MAIAVTGKPIESSKPAMIVGFFVVRRACSTARRCESFPNLMSTSGLACVPRSDRFEPILEKRQGLSWHWFGTDFDALPFPDCIVPMARTNQGVSDLVQDGVQNLFGAVAFHKVDRKFDSAPVVNAEAVWSK
jgi:hypothetical protein